MNDFTPIGAAAQAAADDAVARSLDVARALGERALKVGWRWGLGAVAISQGPDAGPVVVVGVGHDGIPLGGDPVAELVDVVPDFRHAATRGCLLEQVREVMQERRLVVSVEALPLPYKRYAIAEVGLMRGSRWQPVGFGDSETEALVKTLESAFVRRGGVAMHRVHSRAGREPLGATVVEDGGRRRYFRPITAIEESPHGTPPLPSDLFPEAQAVAEEEAANG